MIAISGCFLLTPVPGDRRAAVKRTCFRSLGILILLQRAKDRVHKLLVPRDRGIAAADVGRFLRLGQCKDLGRSNNPILLDSPLAAEYLSSVSVDLNPLCRLFSISPLRLSMCPDRGNMTKRVALQGFVAALTIATLFTAAERAAAQAAQPASAKGADPRVDLDDVKDPPGLKRLAPEGKVWLDSKNKRVVMLGEVCLREGQLEMFACLKGTKEHESILAVPTKAQVVHAALVALGADPGAPAQFAPQYKPAHGPRVDVTLFWTDEKNQRHQAPAQDWIRNVKTGKAMSDYWVFGGSGFWKDEMTGEEFYKAEDGDFICISNFNSAMLDLPIESSQSNEALLFEAFTEHIPPSGTKVSVVLTPRLTGKAGEKPQPTVRPAAKPAEK
jgi:hypothetical protein